MRANLSYAALALLVAVDCAGSLGAAIQVPAAMQFQQPLDVAARSSPFSSSGPLLSATAAGQRLIATGWRGHIVYSDDQGVTWKQAQVPVSVDLVALSFPTAMQGWAVGHGGVILHTKDGGATWQRQADGRSLGTATVRYYEERARDGDPAMTKILGDAKANFQNGAELPWLGIHFVNLREGYVVGPFNSIMKTEDGGASWVPWMERIDNPNGLHLNAISSIGGRIYIAAEQGAVFQLSASGERFALLDTGHQGSFFGLTGTDTLILAYGLGGAVLRSVDQGQSWQPVKSGLRGGVNGGAVLANGRIALVTQDGQLLLAAADGNRLVPIKLQQTMLFAGLSGFQAGKVLAVGMRGTLVVDTATVPR